jgi:hypothetical protein
MTRLVPSERYSVSSCQVRIHEDSPTDIAHNAYLLHGDKFSINCNECSRFRELFEAEAFVLDDILIAIPMR